MILVTGGTGFIGRALIRHLTEAGHRVRTLIRPSPISPRLPRGTPVEIAVSTLSDSSSLRAAMVGVDMVIHLAGVEKQGAYADLMEVDIKGTKAVVQAAEEVGLDRFIYLSHIGAERASAYPVFKAKAIAEEFIRKSSLEYTILRTAIIYGLGDGFTTGLAQIISSIPFYFIVPGDGSSLLQPLWVEDLATCITWALDNNDTRNQTYEIGGPENMSFIDIVELIMQELNLKRRIMSVRPPFLRGLTVTLEALFPNIPPSVFWLDYLAVDRTCALDTIPRVFKVMPARMAGHLQYLRSENWRRSMIKTLFK